MAATVFIRYPVIELNDAYLSNFVHIIGVLVSSTQAYVLCELTLSSAVMKSVCYETCCHNVLQNHTMNYQILQTSYFLFGLI